jgi:pimeloyl-ACP methyl ester carboxylesterase
MPTAQHGEVTLEYVVDGDPEDVPLLLVNGLGGQLINWDAELVGALVDRGFFVIRFDNRDAGLSTKTVSDLKIGPALLAALGGEPLDAPYVLSDMAGDVVAVLDAVGLDAAHVVGVSLGGMVGQTLAIEHPHRVRTLTSIMSTTGDTDVGQPDPDSLPYILSPSAKTRDEAVERVVEMFRFIGGGVHFDEDRMRETAGRAYDRCFHPRGVGYQILAYIASGSRTEALRTLAVPTLVIHGDKDRLIGLSGGERTAEVIPGAELLVLEDMGHDLPSFFWPVIVEAILGLVVQASADR